MLHSNMPSHVGSSPRAMTAQRAATCIVPERFTKQLTIARACLNWPCVPHCPRWGGQLHTFQINCLLEVRQPNLYSKICPQSFFTLAVRDWLRANSLIWSSVPVALKRRLQCVATITKKWKCLQPTISKGCPAIHWRDVLRLDRITIVTLPSVCCQSGRSSHLLL